MARAPDSISADDVSDQEVASAEGFLVLVDDAADVEALADEGLVVGWERDEEFLEALDGGAAAELLDEVSARACDDHRFADRTAALADDGVDLNRALDEEGGGAVVSDGVVK